MKDVRHDSLEKNVKNTLYKSQTKIVYGYPVIFVQKKFWL